jgi:hypothetical protein
MNYRLLIIDYSLANKIFSHKTSIYELGIYNSQGIINNYI